MSQVREPIWGTTRRLELLQDISEYLKGLLYRVTHKPLWNFILLSLIGVVFILATVIYTTEIDEFRDSSNEVELIQDDGVAIVMEIVSFFGDAGWALFLIPVLYLGFTPDIGGRYTAVILCVGYITAVVKVIIHEGRPFWMDKDVEGYACDTDFGMPSGLSSITVVLYLYLARELWMAMPGYGGLGDLLADEFHPKNVLDRKDLSRRNGEEEDLRRREAEEARYAEEPMLAILTKYRKIRLTIRSQQREFIEEHSSAISYSKIVTTLVVRALLLVVTPLIIISVGFSKWYLGSDFWMQIMFGYIFGLIIFLLWTVGENLLKRYHHNLINHSLFLQIVVWSFFCGFFLSIGIGSWFATFYTFNTPNSWETNFESDCSDDIDLFFEPAVEAIVALIVATHAALFGHSITTRVCVRDWWRVGYCRRVIRTIIGFLGTVILFAPFYFGIPKDTYFTVRLVFVYIVPVYAAVYWVFGVMPWIASHCCCGRLGVKDFEWEETFARANVLYQETDEVSMDGLGYSSSDDSTSDDAHSSPPSAESEVDEEKTDQPSDRLDSLPPSTSSL